MVLAIIKEIESCIRNENFLGALSLALTLPDICGKAHYPREETSFRYRKWYEENIGKYDVPMLSVDDNHNSRSVEVKMPYLNGEMLYSLRNSFFHQGTLNVSLNKNHLDRCKVTHFTLFVDEYTHGGSAIVQSILIENRCGSVYRGGKFILSKIQDIAALCDAIEGNQLQLRIAFDIPQIYTAHNAKTEREYIGLLEETKLFREYIGGVHLWGNRVSEPGRKVAHCGDLKSYFGDADVKQHFLEAFRNCFDDDVVRKMVLEVNSGNEDLMSIIRDLKSVGIVFFSY